MVKVAPPPKGTTVMVVGPIGVGKTSIIRRLAGREYDDALITSGLPLGREIIVLVFTQANIGQPQFWAEYSDKLEKHKEMQQLIYFVQSKIDTVESLSEELEAVVLQNAEKFNAKYFRVSAKTGHGFDEFQSSFTKDIVETEKIRLAKYHQQTREMQMYFGTAPIPTASPSSAGSTSSVVVVHPARPANNVNSATHTTTAEKPQLPPGSPPAGGTSPRRSDRKNCITM